MGHFCCSLNSGRARRGKHDESSEEQEIPGSPLRSDRRADLEVARDTRVGAGHHGDGTALAAGTDTECRRGGGRAAGNPRTSAGDRASTAREADTLGLELPRRPRLHVRLERVPGRHFLNIASDRGLKPAIRAEARKPGPDRTSASQGRPKEGR